MKDCITIASNNDTYLDNHDFSLDGVCLKCGLVIDKELIPNVLVSMHKKRKSGSESV